MQDSHKSLIDPTGQTFNDLDYLVNLSKIKGKLADMVLWKCASRVDKTTISPGSLRGVARASCYLASIDDRKFVTATSWSQP